MENIFNFSQKDVGIISVVFVALFFLRFTGIIKQLTQIDLNEYKNKIGKKHQ